MLYERPMSGPSGPIVPFRARLLGGRRENVGSTAKSVDY